jgi:hypothetical protein
MKTDVSLFVALKNLCLILFVCVFASISVPAQSIAGRVVGTITDQAGASVRNAEVTVTSEGTGAQRRSTTDENGFYVIPELAIGFYTLKVEGNGFAPAIKTRIKIDVGAETRVEVTLQVQATAAVVDVRAEAPLLQPDSSSLASVINNMQVESSPPGHHRPSPYVNWRVPHRVHRVAHWAPSQLTASAKRPTSS